MLLDCPMPESDFEIITLGHGSGGMLTQQLLDSGVFTVLSNPLLDQRHDGSVFEMQGKIAFSTDSYVVSPVFFPGGDIGELAVYGTVNDLAMCGAKPLYLSLSFIIEEGLKMEDFRKILNSIRSACEVAGVQIVTGDTKVVERGKGDQIFINTSGLGQVHPRAAIRADRIKAGDQIILSNSIANHGMCIMSLRKGLSFESEIRSDTRPLNHTVFEMLDVFGADIHFLRDPTRGGVASVLNEIAAVAGVGAEIVQNKLQITEPVASACEMLGIDPLYVANEGVFIAIVTAQRADEIVAFLRQQSATGDASIIGEITADHPRQVLLKTPYGGKRFVNQMPGDLLPRIC